MITSHIAHRLAFVLLLATSALAADKKIVLIAGKPSHGPGDHEFRAGSLLLKQCLDSVPGVTTVVHTNGWPATDAAFDGAAAVLIYADGGGGHPGFQGDRAKVLDALAAKGVGLGFAHYGVEVEKGAPGQAMLKWVGGYYEGGYSVNPMWRPDYQSFPEHPVTRGVKPFALIDEWYFNMRWPEDPARVKHLLVAKPSDAVRNGPYVYPAGPYPHIQAAKGRDETMMWVTERPGGGRGLGFTGGHKHVNWSNENFRKVVLNGLLWLAGVDVPPQGVESKLAPGDIAKNLDPKGAPAGAPNLSGAWQFKVETATFSAEPRFEFAHAGNNLLGRYSGRLGEADVFGSCKGAEVHFSFTGVLDGTERKVTYTGRVEGPDLMKGTVRSGEFEGTWTATR